MTRTNKKGFTIVELVIVIAVVAILAAVLIPTFANLVNKANRTADIQAVNQMNKTLAVNEVLKDKDIFEVFTALEEAGMSAKDYKPLSKDMYFFWDKDLNRIVYVDSNNTVVYPAEYEGQTYGANKTWISLTASIKTSAPADTNAADGLTIANGAELSYVVEKIREDASYSNNLVLDLSGNTVDMMGANMNISVAGLTIKNGTIKNATGIDANYLGTGGEGSDGVYDVSGLFANAKDITIEDVTFENIYVKNTNASNAGLLIAKTSGNVTIKNVTIKNSTIIAHRTVGALIGNPKDGGTLTLDGNIVLDNVQVKTVGGRSGLIIGLVDANKIVKGADLAITLKNGSSYGIYSCEQNTGTFNGQTLGLDANTNILYSYAYNNTAKDNKLEDKFYFANAYATEWVNGAGSAAYTGFDAVVTVE